jgi:RNA polymerase sigma factor (sigma-70 family)
MARTDAGTAGRRRNLGAMSDGDVVGLAIAGDERAWGELADRFQGRVTAIARRFRLSASDAADVSQLTWLQLHRSITRLREPASVGAWLSTTARRECLRLVARREDAVDPTMLPEPANGTDDPADSLVAAESRAAVQRAMGRLTPRGRQLVERLVWHDQTYDDVSKAMDMPVGSIGPTRLRCLATLGRSPELLAVVDGDRRCA